MIHHKDRTVYAQATCMNIAYMLSFMWEGDSLSLPQSFERHSIRVEGLRSLLTALYALKIALP
jgi:hypothetical protein